MTELVKPASYEQPRTAGLPGLSLPSLGLGLSPVSSWLSDFAPAPTYSPAEYETNEYAYSGGALGGDSSIVDIARSYEGQNRYEYGGFDCSKYTQIVAEQYGVTIPRSTGGQIPFFQKQNMWSSNLNDARPGDLIYLKSGSSPSGRHVGVYVGGGMMIDNAGKGKPITSRKIDPDKVIGVGQLSRLKQGDADPAYPLAAYGAKDGESHKGTAMYGLQEPMARALREANDAMSSAGLGRFGITSGYRSIDEQKKLHERQPETSSKPGKSVHQLGLAADLRLTAQQEAWIKKNAAHFGLVTFPSEGWHVQSDPNQWKGF